MVYMELKGRTTNVRTDGSDEIEFVEPKRQKNLRKHLRIVPHVLFKTER